MHLQRPPLQYARFVVNPTLAETLDDPSNNFNLVRLIAAMMVVISHSFLVTTGQNESEPLSWSAYDLGATAVNIFFVMSGMMVSRSFEKQPNLTRFLRARMLRIYPGLIVASIGVAMVVGPLGTDVSLSQYFTDIRTWTYPFRVLYDFDSAVLPDTFLHNALPTTNMPLWTIRYELLAYIGFVALAAVGLARRGLVLCAAIATSGILMVAYSGTGASLFRFAFAFLAGVVAFRFGNTIRLSRGIALLFVITALVMIGTPIAPLLSILSVGYAAMVVASQKLPAWGHDLLKTDLSYGIYLYAWPVQQTLAHYMTWEGPMIAAHIILSLIITGPLAALSWVLVEKPALGWKNGITKGEILGRAR